jgi:hypothetical protein
LQEKGPCGPSVSLLISARSISQNSLFFSLGCSREELSKKPQLFLSASVCNRKRKRESSLQLSSPPLFLLAEKQQATLSFKTAKQRRKEYPLHLLFCSPYSKQVAETISQPLSVFTAARPKQQQQKLSLPNFHPLGQHKKSFKALLYPYVRTSFFTKRCK